MRSPISGSFSKLTDKPFSQSDLKIRIKQASQRRTFGYFLERKFELEEVISELNKYGFERDNYQRIIVTWGATLEAEEQAKLHNVLLWDFRDLLHEIADASKVKKTYFNDDTARTIQLFDMAASGRKATVA